MAAAAEVINVTPTCWRRQGALLGLAACWLACGLTTSAAGQQAAPAAGEEVPVSFRYRLRTDNNLVLRAGRLDAKGTRSASRVKVVIARDGQILASVRTDEWGGAQVIGLKPAVYSVLTAGSDGFAAFTVRVLPFEAAQEADRAQPGLARRRDGGPAVEIHLAPNSEYSFLKTLMQHKGDFVLLAVREGDVVTTIEPRDTGRYRLSGVATGCYSVLGGGITHSARMFYASGVYHVEKANGSAPAKRGTSQLIPGGRSAREGVRLAGFVEDNADDDDDFSPCPDSDYPILDQLVDEVNRGLAGAPPVADAAPVQGAQAAGGGGGGGLGGLLGAAGAGLGVAGLSGGGGLGGGAGGGGGLASDFIPSAPR